MELIPLVKYTVLAFGAIAVAFVLGSFIYYKIKALITGEKKQKTGPAAAPPPPPVQQQKPVVAQNVAKPAPPPPPPPPAPQQAAYPPQQQQQSYPQQPPYPQQQGYPQQQYYDQQGAYYDQRHQTPAYPSQQMQSSGRSQQSYYADQGRYAPERRMRAQSKVYQAYVKPKEERIQVINNQQAALRSPAPQSAGTPYYYPRPEQKKAEPGPFPGRPDDSRRGGRPPVSFK